MINDILTILHQNEIITSIDVHFAKFVSSFPGGDNPEVLLGAALTSNATYNKHLCLDLSLHCGKVLVAGNNQYGEVRCPLLDEWREKMICSDAVGSPGDYRPLILDKKNRLYLYRYWNYEKVLGDELFLRASEDMPNIDLTKLIESIKRLYKQDADSHFYKHTTACIVSCFKKLCVITGGPGTGKTFAIGKILAALLEQPGNQNIKVFLCAPTGKAAIKLGEAVKKVKEDLDCSPLIKEAIPSTTQTIHRMLKPIYGSPYFFYNKYHQLPADVVVVDEASMVDAALMSKLIQAVPENARLILIGDKDQLASVEAGAFMGDLCYGINPHGVSKRWAKAFNEITGRSSFSVIDQKECDNKISDCMIRLDRSFRFEESGDIDILGDSVNKGDFDQSIAILKNKSRKSIRFEAISSQGVFLENLETLVVNGYKKYFKAENPVEALEQLGYFKILCALNKGKFGVEKINEAAEYFLVKAGLIKASEEWYRGRPVMILKNDYKLGLFNGDIGIIWPLKELNDKKPFAFFKTSDNEIRHFPPHRLPEHETVYAMTVHKSQGSEFEHVVLVLPENDAQVLTRELLYTGITRAKKSITIHGCEEIFKIALSRRIERHSGLKDRLWG